MGQKVNALSFRSSEKLNYLPKSLWYINLNNFKYSLFLHDDFLIKDFLFKFFHTKKIYIHDIIIKRYANYIYINILLYKFNEIKNKKKFNKSKSKIKKKTNKKYYLKSKNSILKKNTKRKIVFNKNNFKRKFSTTKKIKKKFRILPTKKKKQIKFFLYQHYLKILLLKFLKINYHTKLILNLNPLIKVYKKQNFLKKKLLKKKYNITKLHVEKKQIKKNKIRIPFALQKLNDILLKRTIKYKRNFIFTETINLMTIIFIFRSSNILSQFIILNLKTNNKKKQYQFLIYLNNILRICFDYFKISNYIDGLKIQLSGKVYTGKRARIRTFIFGKTPLQTIKTNVEYTFNDFITKDGKFGLKVWLFYKKS